MKMWLNMSLKVVKRIIAFPFMLCWLILFPPAELFAWAVNGITGEDIIDKEQAMEYRVEYEYCLNNRQEIENEKIQSFILR